MAKFNKGSDSGEGRRGRGARPASEGSAAGGEKKSGGYKAKRSFSKNKSFREKAGDKKPGRSFGRSDRGPFRREGDRDKPARKFGERSERPERKFGDEKPGRKFGERSERPERKFDDKKPARKFGERSERPERKFGDEKPARKFGEKSGRPERKFDDKKPARKFGERSGRPDREDKPRRQGGDRERPYFDKSERDRESTPKRSFEKRDGDVRPEKREEKKAFFDRDKRPARDEAPTEKKKRFSKPRPGDGNYEERSLKRVKHDELEEGKGFSKERRRDGFGDKKRSAPAPKPAANPDGLIRLNKYLSNAGIASRREADTLIQSGAVKVNGVVIDQLGYKIKATDKVTYGDEAVRTERKVYLLLNKPKDYISTVDDPQERKTVMDLIAGACRERLYPVGRLDRNTTGLLLMTNDGDLTKKLTHPKLNIKKLYHVSLNKGLKAEDFKSIIEGVELEDGLIQADDLAFVGEGKKEVGIEIHSGRNRIIRRLFEHLGYDVLKLDRVSFAGLTKKDLPRGKHRFLTPKEIAFLQMLG